MEQFHEILGRWLSAASGFVWGAPLLILLCGTHLFLTWRLRFIQPAGELASQNPEVWAWVAQNCQIIQAGQRIYDCGLER